MQNLIDIQRQIESLQNQASELKSKQFKATVADIVSTMKAFGITLKDLQAFKKRSNPTSKSKMLDRKMVQVKGKRAVVAPKYRGPNGETWSGRGLMPKWLTSLVASGQSRESFLIALETRQGT